MVELSKKDKYRSKLKTCSVAVTNKNRLLHPTNMRSLEVSITCVMFALVVSGFSGFYYTGVPRMLRGQRHIALNMNKKVVIVGGTGYIGKYVVKESVKRGYATTVVLRQGAGTLYFPKTNFHPLIYRSLPPCKKSRNKTILQALNSFMLTCVMRLH